VALCHGNRHRSERFTRAHVQRGHFDSAAQHFGVLATPGDLCLAQAAVTKTPT